MAQSAPVASPEVRVSLEPLTVGIQTEFLEAVGRSRGLHRGWAAPPRTVTAFRAFVRRSRRAAQWVRVVRTPEGALAGVVALSEIVRGNFQSAYMGYYAFEPHAGQGYMRAGVRAALRAAFGELGLHRVEANIQPANRRSIDLARGLGFEREGLSCRRIL